MLKSLIAIIAFIYAFAPAVTFALDDATVHDAKCIQDPNDPFDPAVMMAGGPNQGLCILTTSGRSIELVSAEVIAKNQLNAPEGWSVFANFQHDGKFWYASLDPKGSEAVIFQIEAFPAIVPAAHTQLRVKMKAGHEVELVEQAPLPGVSPQRKKLAEIVFSDESVFTHPGESFDIITGLESKYAIAYRVKSMADSFDFMITKQNHQVRQYELNISDDDRTNIVRNAIAMSSDLGMHEYYNTLLRSCTTEIFHLLDRSLHYNFFEDLGLLAGSLVLDQTYPPESDLGLALRGLLKSNDGSRLPDAGQDQQLISELQQGL